MLDDFREQAKISFFEEDEGTPDASADDEIEAPHSRRRGNFLGLAPWQRFFLTVMLFSLVFLIGFLALLVTEKIILPGL